MKIPRKDLLPERSSRSWTKPRSVSLLLWIPQTRKFLATDGVDGEMKFLAANGVDGEMKEFDYIWHHR